MVSCQAEHASLIPGSGRYPEEGNGNPLQYSCLGYPTDRGAWQAIVPGVTRVKHDLATKEQTTAFGEQEKAIRGQKGKQTLSEPEVWKWRQLMKAYGTIIGRKVSTREDIILNGGQWSLICIHYFFQA